MRHDLTRRLPLKNKKMPAKAKSIEDKQDGEHELKQGWEIKGKKLTINETPRHD